MAYIHDEFQINDALVGYYNANLPRYVAQHSGKVVRLTFNGGDVSEQFYAGRNALPPKNCWTRISCLDQLIPVVAEGHLLRTFKSFLEEPDVVPSEDISRAISEAVQETKRKRLDELSGR